MTDFSLWRSIGALTLALTVCACSDLSNCPAETKNLKPIMGASDPVALTYESAPWYGTLASFPAKSQLRFVHNLGVIPLVVKVYLSFNEHGTNGADGGSVAESAGNQDLIECVDAHVIDIKNDTCEKDFYIRVVAAEAAPPADPADPTAHFNDCVGGAANGGGGGGAGTSGGASEGGASEGGAAAGAPG